jgi:enamine deaminase RidA (YjgF/YER057c/UK114 family)
MMKPVNPNELGPAKGFSHGMLGPRAGRILFVAGQTAADSSGHVEERAFLAQFEAALAKALAVVRAAGGRVEDIGRMTVYVTDIAAYREARKALGGVWQKHMGTHYPAMALVQVSELVDRYATVEIEVTAVVPEAPEPQS